MNNQRATRSKRKTRIVSHNATTLIWKIDGCQLHPKRPRSPVNTTKLASPTESSTPPTESSTPRNGSTRNPSASLLFGSLTALPLALQPAVAIYSSTKVSTPLTWTEKVSSRDILSQSKLPQVTTATTDDGLLLKKTFKTQVPLTGARPFGNLTVDVEVVQDDASDTYYCLTKWYGQSGVGHYELDGPCSLTEAHDVFTGMSPFNEKFNTFWSPSKRMAAMPVEGSLRFVRGYFIGKEKGAPTVIPTQVTS
ncbi:unnamed protein product [Aphanomyces euteiches]